MTPQEARQEVDTWVSKMTTVSSNISDLSQSSCAQLIRARLKDQIHPYMGMTKERGTAALTALDNLWQSYLVLSRVIEEALDLSKKTGIFHDSEADASKIAELLETASVALPGEFVPIASRDLLSDSQKVAKVTPQALLDAMVKDFTMARDTIAAIDQAESHGRPMFEALKQEAATLEKWASTLGTQTSLHDISQALSNVEADPLDALEELDRIQSDITDFRSRLQAIENERNATVQALEKTRSVIAEIKDTASRSEAALREVRDKVAAPEGLLIPISSAEIDSMDAWAGTLDETIRSGHVAPAKVGISKLSCQCDVKLAEERQKYASNRAPLDEMAELKGRYQALCVKARAVGAKNPDQAGAIEDLGNRVKNIIDSRPFSLRDARQIVGAFEAILSGKKVS